VYSVSNRNSKCLKSVDLKEYIDFKMFIKFAVFLYVQKIQVGLLCSTPLSTLFQLYHSVSFIGGGNRLVPRENNWPARSHWHFNLSEKVEFSILKKYFENFAVQCYFLYLCTMLYKYLSKRKPVSTQRKQLTCQKSLTLYHTKYRKFI
jgi:hypothetical protein